LAEIHREFVIFVFKTLSPENKIMTPHFFDGQDGNKKNRAHVSEHTDRF